MMGRNGKETMSWVEEEGDKQNLLFQAISKTAAKSFAKSRGWNLILLLIKKANLLI